MNVLSNNEILHSPVGRAISKSPTSFTSEVQVTSDVVFVASTVSGSQPTMELSYR